MAKEIYYDYKEDGINTIIDEAPGTNTFIALREIRWDPSKDYKLDLRKYFMKSDGTESPGKGFSFATEAGPNVLVEKLVEYGFGSVATTVQHMYGRDRQEFVDSVADQLQTEEDLNAFTEDLNTSFHNKDGRTITAREQLNEILSKGFI